ncbi:MAG: integrase core domain-containing protein [Pseudomonadota bacterium]|nr:integrase core domain-containing protein [Pseudomonadota bacterium]
MVLHRRSNGRPSQFCERYRCPPSLRPLQRVRVIADWIQFYNTRRPHQALGMRTPAEAYALAA